MSYFYSVNRDNPLGYFPIDNDYKYYSLKRNFTTYGGGYDRGYGYGAVTGDTHDNSSGNLYGSFSNYASINTLKVLDQTAKNNTPSLNALSYMSPIVMNNSTSVKIGSSSSIDINNVYDVFVPSSNPHTWSAEFWLCLDWQDGQGLDFTPYDSFSTNNFRTDLGFRSSISTYPKMLLLSIGYYTTDPASSTRYFYNYASVIYNQQTNCVEFYVPQADGSYKKSFSPISDLDSPMHVYVTYSNQTINIAINGVNGISAYVGNGLYADANIANNYYNLIFRFAGGYSYIDGSGQLQTVQMQSNQYLLLSNLIFYDYVLSARQLKNHIRWAYFDNKPIKSSVQYGTHYINLEESSSNFIYNKYFSGLNFSDYTDLYNLKISGQGLQPSKINTISFNNLDKTSTLTTPVDLSGVNWIGGKAALDFSDFGSISSLPCTLSLIVEPDNTNYSAASYATTGALGTTGNLVGGTITTTYSNGTSGVGATLTIATSSNWTSIKIDNQTLNIGDRILIKNQSSALQNGIYTVTSVGAVGNIASFIFTRASNYDSITEIKQGGIAYVLNGSTNANSVWVESQNVSSIGSSSINFSQSATSNIDEYIWSISNVNGSSTLFVDRSSGVYNLKYYDVLNGGTITTIASVTPNYFKPYHKIAVSLNNNSALLTVISAASENIVDLINDTTTASTPSTQTLSFSKNSIFSIGQSYYNGNDTSVLKKNSSTFSYLGISDIYISDFTNKYINGYYYSNGYPWNGIIKYSCPLQYYYDQFNPVSVSKSFTVNQMGYWITTIPLSSMDSIVGSKIEWNGTNNCLVEYSFNDPNITHPEQNWYSVTRNGGPITGYNFSNKLTNMRIRVTMITKYNVEDTNQSFNELRLDLYRNMNFYSDGEAFSLTPISRSSNNTSFTTKDHLKTIQARPNNLGLLFAYSNDDSSAPGAAKISNTYSKNLRGIDLWLRNDTNYNSSHIITGNDTIAGSPDLYIDANGRFVWNSNVDFVYINGIPVTNFANATTTQDFIGTYTVSPLNPLHIAATFRRKNIISNPSFTINNSGWTSAQSAGVVRNSTYSYGSSTYSGRSTITTNSDLNIATYTVSLSPGVYTVSGYFYIPTGSLLAGRTISIAAETTGATTSNSSAATLTAGTWTRASARITVTSSSVLTTAIVARLNTPSTISVSSASGNGTTITYTATNHGLVTGQKVTIAGFTGATAAGYNQTTSKAITYINANSFSISGSQQGLSAGTATATIDSIGNIIYTDSWLAESGTVLGTYIDDTEPYTGDLYLNGTTTLAGSESSYGFINLWETRMTQQDAVDRYNLFIFNNNSIVINDNDMSSIANPVNVDMQKDLLIPHKIGR